MRTRRRLGVIVTASVLGVLVSCSSSIPTHGDDGTPEGVRVQEYTPPGEHYGGKCLVFTHDVSGGYGPSGASIAVVCK
jgi:hypothetical protein